MRRWNGWGDDMIDFPLSVGALRFLLEKIGPGQPLPDAAFEDIVARVASSRLPDHPLVSKSPEKRLLHSRGQSLPDWIALRSGKVDCFPDGVAFPETSEEVQDILAYAKAAGAAVIPYGGGTSVVGHITPEAGGKPVLSVVLSRMNRLIDLDEVSRIATFGAGVAGPDIEAQLRAQGYTLGHFPQSFEYSTLGGWVATRSSGQQSLRYGRIEQLFAGGRMETPEGTLNIPAFPASATGPDLREMILGSEGRLGILTEIKVKVSPLPERERFWGIFFPDWESGLDGARQAIQARIPLSMLRLCSPEETETQLALADHRRLTGLLERWLALRGAGKDRCLLFFGITGTKPQFRSTQRQAGRAFKRAKGFIMGRYLGRKWAETRFTTPYIRNTLWDRGYAVDTLETATDWDKVNTVKVAIQSALHNAASERGNRVHVFTHLSHLYAQGASVYTTYIFPLGETHEKTLLNWQILKKTASQAIIRHGGTISHQHGVGQDHAPYIQAEKGPLGLEAIKNLFRSSDPEGIMNPGKLIP